VMVNNYTEIIKANNHWKFMYWLGTGTKMWYG